MADASRRGAPPGAPPGGGGAADRAAGRAIMARAPGGAHPGRPAEVGEVRRQAVGEVDHGAGPGGRRREPLDEAGYRTPEPGEAHRVGFLALPEGDQGGPGAAEGAGDEDAVAGSGAAPEDRAGGRG